MLTTIHITVCDRVPTITEGEEVISFNSDYVAEFDFDEEWQSNVKTVYFVCEDGSNQPVVMNGNSCDVPMMAGEHRRIFVGVQEGTSIKPGKLKTTRACCLKVKDSIADYLGQPIPDPTPDVYEQIIAMLNNLTTPTWDAVQNKPFESLGDGLEVDENGVLSVPGGGGGSANAVQYVAQSLTDEQKKQARTNIDADKKRLIYNATRGNYGRVNLFDSVSSQNAAIDKIIAEYKAGTEVVMRLQNLDFPLNQIEENAGKIWFSSYSVTTDAKMNVVTFMLEKDTTTVEESFINGIKPVDIDRTLQESGYAADAKAVGDALTEVDTKLDEKQPKGNYLTAESDPTVPSWAKSPTKPTYTAEEVGALPDTTVIPPAYTLPQATADALGGIKADAATAEDTQDVRIGADGKLKTKPTSGSNVTVDSALSLTSENPVQNKIITAALAEKITAPTTAAVGQIIKVKSVDDAGKPTEWEAADMPSGGGKEEPTTNNLLCETVFPANNVAAQEITCDVTCAQLAQYKELHFIIRGANNTSIPNLYLSVAGIKDAHLIRMIAAGFYGIVRRDFENSNLVRVWTGTSNPSLVPDSPTNSKTYLYDTFAIGMQPIILNWTKIFAAADKKLILKCSSTPTIDYTLKIYGVVAMT